MSRCVTALPTHGAALAYDETGGRAWSSVAIKLGRAAEISETSLLDSKATARATRDRNDSKHGGHFTGGCGLRCGGGHRVGDHNGTSQLQAEMQAESYGNGATNAQLKERESDAFRIQGRWSRETSRLRLRLRVDASRRDRSMSVRRGYRCKRDWDNHKNVTNRQTFAWQSCQWVCGVLWRGVRGTSDGSDGDYRPLKD